MDSHILKRHNKTLLLYHVVFPVKYRDSVITEEVGVGLKKICVDLSQRYEIHFLEILWGGNFWTSGYYTNTVGQYGNKDVIKKHIENQGKEVKYQKVYEAQLTLFDI